jgi:glycosyltransferase involved in cell wall biosynthesis
VSRHVQRHRGRGNVVVAPQAVDVPHYSAPVSPSEREAWRRRAGARPDDLLVLFVGRLEREKGIDVLLEAWQQARLGGGARLVFAGQGPLVKAISAGGESVRALGQVTSRELPALYAASDLLVVPSIPTRTFVEPWGLVVNEAMLQCTPVLATDAVGAAAGGLLRDGETGITVPAGDAHALANRLEELARTPELRRALGGAAREAAQGLTAATWAEGMARALALAGAGRSAKLAGAETRPPVVSELAGRRSGP